MANYTTHITRITFALTFFEAESGENWVPVDRRKFKLAFKAVYSRRHLKLAVSSATFSLSYSTLALDRNIRLAKLVPTSFFLLTSRTSPLAPQPVLAAPFGKAGEFRASAQGAKPRHYVTHVGVD